jgi:hypothetical protein
MTARISPEKRTKILKMIEPMLAPTCTEVSGKQMASLNGLLNWACELLVAGRFHLTHNIAAFRKCKARGKAKARVTSAHRQELRLDPDATVVHASEYSYEASPTTPMPAGHQRSLAQGAGSTGCVTTGSSLRQSETCLTSCAWRACWPAVICG